MKLRTALFSLALVLSGCAEVPSSDRTYDYSGPAAPDDSAPSLAARPRIRVAIALKQTSVRLRVPQSFVLTGFSTGPDPADGTAGQAREMTLTAGQMQGHQATLTPMDGGEVRVNGKPYRGSLQILSDGDGTLTVINDVDLEDYVMGVVSGEVPKNWPLEALKAQAIAARTFAVLKHTEALQAGNAYDLENTALFQMYQGSGALNENIQRAVEETGDEIITYDDKPIEAFFHSNCGGETCGAVNVWSQDKPYLQPVVCGYCRQGPHFQWKTVVPTREMVRDLRAVGMELGDVAGIQALKRDDSGRISVLGILDSDGTLRDIKSNSFRMALGPDVIRSTRFQAAVGSESVTFEGLGWGHGVGLCQEGACGMAQKGFNAYEIIRHYYRGVLVERLRTP